MFSLTTKLSIASTACREVLSKVQLLTFIRQGRFCVTTTELLLTSQEIAVKGMLLKAISMAEECLGLSGRNLKKVCDPVLSKDKSDATAISFALLPLVTYFALKSQHNSTFEGFLNKVKYS